MFKLDVFVCLFFGIAEFAGLEIERLEFDGLEIAGLDWTVEKKQ